MYFGGSSFAAAPFGATAGQSIRAAVSGSRVNLSTGSPTIIGKVVVTLSGNRINATIGNVTTRVDQQVAVTGNRINLATGTVDVISWNPIPPGVSQTWVEIDPLNP
jgi:hypothetical protein